MCPISIIYGTISTLLLTCFLFRSTSKTKGNILVNAPTVGPTGLLCRWYFSKHAWQYIEEGYSKFKGSTFKVSGNDIVILPQKYVDELRNLPDEAISSIQANIDNFEGLHSTTSLLLEGTLHTYTIQTGLTPKLGTLVPGSQKVLNKTFKALISATTDEYIGFPAFHLVLSTVARIASKHFVEPMCENEEWLETALQYTENAFRTIIILRIFPDWLKPFVAFFLPCSYKVTHALRRAKEIIVPVVMARRRAESFGDSSYIKPTDLLQMMMDNASEYDGQPQKLAHRLLILILAAQHTTSMAACQALFDLCARPEYIDILRAEVKDVTDREQGFQKQSLTHMRKLDSFLRESQRLSPPSLLGFKRHVRQQLTLSDGAVLPKNTHLMMPIYPIVVDPKVTTDPMTFDGLRHYNLRQRPGELNKHQFATTSNVNMHFGHGRFACPGRFFAATSIKLFLANLLLKYDFKFDDAEPERPPHLCVHEYVFPNPERKVYFKLRE